MDTMMFNRDSFGEMFGSIAKGIGRKPNHIGKTVVTDKRGRKWLVSTVELCVLHHNGDHETMVFPTTGGADDEPTSWGDIKCVRYYGEEDAKEGHARVVADMANFDEEVEE